MNSGPAKILLAEDNRADARLLVECLIENGLDHELAIVENGEDALRYARSAGVDGGPDCPDLFILDLMLPRVDGIEVLTAFRANDNCIHTPVVIFTSVLAVTHRIEAESFAGVYYLQKPAMYEGFLALGFTIKQLLIQREGA